MESKPFILVVEDDRTIRNFICVSLSTQGYQFIETGKGREAISLITSQNPEIIILDLGLPDIDGLEVIESVRKWSKVPIIVVSARGQEREKVEALDSGADDYLTKPFSISELLARVRVAIRHFNSRDLDEGEIHRMFTAGDLEIDFEKRHVNISGEDVHLTPIEYKLVALLAKYAGKVLTHNFILKEIWGPYSGNDNQTLRVFMANIRRKLEKDPGQPRYILTEVGVGYRLVDE